MPTFAEFTGVTAFKHTLPIHYDTASKKTRREVRHQYNEEQGGLCHHCGEPLNSDPAEEIQEAAIYEELFPRGFFNSPVHLHHSHETGLTTGAVHARCNAFLWQYFLE